MTDWTDNTSLTPFFNQKKVEVMTDEGKIYFVDCPSCVRRMNSLVVKWRAVETSDAPSILELARQWYKKPTWNWGKRQ